MTSKLARRARLLAFWARLVDAVHWSRVLVVATLGAPLLGSGALFLLPPLLAMAVRDRKRPDLRLPLVLMHIVPAFGVAVGELWGGNAELLQFAWALLALGVLAAAVFAILALGFPRSRRLHGLAMACISFGALWWPGIQALYLRGQWTPSFSWWALFPGLLAVAVFFESSRHFRLQELAERLQLSKRGGGWRGERLLLYPSGRLRYALAFDAPIADLFIARRPPSDSLPAPAYRELDATLELSLPAALEPLRGHPELLARITHGAGAFASRTGIVAERRVDPDAPLAHQYETALDLLGQGEALLPLFEQLCILTGQSGGLEQGRGLGKKALHVDLDPQASFARALGLHPNGTRQWRDHQGGVRMDNECLRFEQNLECPKFSLSRRSSPKLTGSALDLFVEVQGASPEARSLLEARQDALLPLFLEQGLKVESGVMRLEMDLGDVHSIRPKMPDVAQTLARIEELYALCEALREALLPADPAPTRDPDA